MTKEISRLLIGAVAMVAVDSFALGEAFSIPTTDGIVVDGRDDDWKDKGLRVAVMSRMSHFGVDVEESGEADLRVGWDDKGLVLIAKVRDEQRLEPGPIHRGDSIEVFVAPAVAAPDYLQVLVAPGIAGTKSDKPRVSVVGHGKLKKAELPAVDLAGGPTADGYAIEMRIPLEVLNIAPKQGSALGFQFIANDRDLPFADIGNYTQRNSQIDHICWFPNRNTYADSAQMVPLRMADGPGKPVLTNVRPDFAGIEARLAVTSLAELAGRELMVTQAGKSLGSTQLVAEPRLHRSAAVITLKGLEKGGAPLELSAGGEVVASIALYRELTGSGKQSVGELARTADEVRRFELMRGLDAATADPLLKEDLARLMPTVELWANGREMALAGRLADPANYLTQGVDAMGPAAVRSDSPLYSTYCLYRARNLIWRAIQGGQPEDIKAYHALARKLLAEAQALVPDNPLINMYLGKPIAWPGPEADTNAPAWANAQRHSLHQLASIIHWWADERQLPSGSYGGGWNDDVEMWRNWWPVMLAFSDRKAEEAQRKLTNAIFAQEHMKLGFSAIMDDVEHSAEDSADTITPMLYLDPAGKEWGEKALNIARMMREIWTAKDDNGRLMFKNILFNSTATGKDTKNAYDTTLSSRALQPVLVYWQRTRDPELTGQITEWLDTWIAATAESRSGKPAGIMPTAIHWPDGRIGGGGGKWWDAEAHSALYNWPAYVPDMLHVMLIAYEVTGEEKYLQPIRSMAQIRADYLSRHPGEAGSNANVIAFMAFGNRAKSASDPENAFPAGSTDWCAAQMGAMLPGPLMAYRSMTGDKQFDAVLRHDGDAHSRYMLEGDIDALTRQLGEVAGAFSSNREGYTSEVRWTDRLFRLSSSYLNGFLEKPMPLPNTRLMYAAATGDPSTWVGARMAAVRWLTPPQDIAALVKRTGPNAFEAELYHFGSGSRELDAQLMALTPGKYEVVLKSSDSELQRSSMDLSGARQNLHLTLPSRKLCTVTVSRVRE